MTPKEGQIRYEIQGYLCFPLPLRRVLRRESVPQNRGECGNMFGLGGVECLNMERVPPFCHSSERQLF